jgi:broad specificity phosphatase PhoE
MNYGDWAGKTRAEVASRWPDLFRQWRHDPFAVQIPGGDSALDLRQRAAAAVHEILARHRDGQTIAVISHQVVVKALVCDLVGLSGPAHWRIRQDLCNITRLDYDPASRSFALTGLNDTCHLDTALPRAAGDGVRLVLVRHGQTAWNVGAGEERFRGRTDLPLDDTGQAQAQAVAERFKQEPVAAIYASPLLRTRQTATPLAERLGLPVQSHDGLLDINYGRFQGMTRSEAADAYPAILELWLKAPSQVRFPDGEGLADVQGRLFSLLDELTTYYSGQTVVLVGHQIVNKVLVCSLLDPSHSPEHVGFLDRLWYVGQDTASVNVFQQVQDGWRALCLNDLCHLAPQT